MKSRQIICLVLAVVLLGSMTAYAQDEPTQITLWQHVGSTEEELSHFDDVLEEFNASQDEWEIVRARVLSQNYDEAIHLAASQDSLPCIVEVDGPFVPNFAWSGYLSPLDDYISDELRDDLLPTMLGTYRDETYAVGYMEGAVAIYAHRSVLEENGIRIPTGVDDPWTREEFDAALDTLAATNQFTYAIELGMGMGTEWFPYALAPFLQSFGGDLINRDTYLTADGVLNSPEAIEWGHWWQSIFERNLAAPSGFDLEGFVAGDIPLMWNGNWFYPVFAEALGDDLAILPPPDMGHGPRIGAASWQWGISSTCEHPDAAWSFIEFLFTAENIAHLNNSTGAIPGLRSAFGLTNFYGEDAPLNILVDFSREYALIRPPTPAYMMIREEFELVCTAIANGADVEETLNAAVANIDADIEANDGYGYSD